MDNASGICGRFERPLLALPLRPTRFPEDFAKPRVNKDIEFECIRHGPDSFNEELTETTPEVRMLSLDAEVVACGDRVGGQHLIERAGDARLLDCDCWGR
jgi:hypothetical protein